MAGLEKTQSVCCEWGFGYLRDARAWACLRDLSQDAISLRVGAVVAFGWRFLPTGSSFFVPSSRVRASHLAQTEDR